LRNLDKALGGAELPIGIKWVAAAPHHRRRRLFARPDKCPGDTSSRCPTLATTQGCRAGSNSGLKSIGLCPKPSRATCKPGPYGVGGSAPLVLSPQSCDGPRRWRDQPYVILFIRHVSPLLLTTTNLPIKKTVRSIKQSSHVHSPFRIASTLLS
jgi:hypothetical protein